MHNTFPKPTTPACSEDAALAAHPERIERPERNWQPVVRRTHLFQPPACAAMPPIHNRERDLLRTLQRRG
jgi:hypothetical protein